MKLAAYLNFPGEDPDGGRVRAILRILGAPAKEGERNGNGPGSLSGRTG